MAWEEFPHSLEVNADGDRAFLETDKEIAQMEPVG
jgi:hypothetical protein